MPDLPKLDEGRDWKRDTEKTQWGEWVRKDQNSWSIPFCVSFLSRVEKKGPLPSWWVNHCTSLGPENPRDHIPFFFSTSEILGQQAPVTGEFWLESQSPAAFHCMLRELSENCSLGFHRSLWEGRGINGGGEGKDRQGELILQWECRSHVTKERKQCSKVMSFPKVYIPSSATVCPQVIWYFELQSPPCRQWL